MNDTSANNFLITAFEESLNRFFFHSLDYTNKNDIDELVSILNRINPSQKCTAMYFDNEKYKDVLVMPTYEELGNICRYLLNFEEKNYVYTPTEYIVCISPTIPFKSVKEIVARILYGIDCMNCKEKLREIKAMLLDKAVENNMISADRVFTFKNNAKFNVNCTALLLPFLVQYYEAKKNYFDSKKLFKYLFEKDNQMDERNSLLVHYGYIKEMPYYEPVDENAKKVLFKSIFDSVWNCLNEYPMNKAELIQQYDLVLCNNNAGEFEKLLAYKAKSCLMSNSSAVFDLNLSKENLNESVKSLMETKRKGYSYLELSEIRVELEIMSTSDDKMYLVTRCHRDLATAERARKFHPSQELEDYIKELKELLREIQEKKIKDNSGDIRITVNYPKGDYEE